MALRILTALLVLGLGACAQAQTDPGPPRTVPRPASCLLVVRPDLLVPCDRAGRDTGTRAVAPDSIEPVDVLRGRRDLGDPMGAEARRRMLDTLAAQRRLWAWRRPRTYVIRTLDMGNAICMMTRPRVNGAGLQLRDRLVVRDTAVVGHEPAPIPDAYRSRCVLSWRVEDLFADVARVIADTTMRVWPVEYDATHGVPRTYTYVRSYPFQGRCHAHACGVRVETFAPAP